MTIKKPLDDERRTHRITTYLSDLEVQLLRNSFEQSEFDNFSQYHRHLIMQMISIPSNTPVVHHINESTSYSLSQTVQAICRFLCELERIESSSYHNKDTEIVRLVKTIHANILYIGDVCYLWARWYRNDTHRRGVIKNIAELTLTSQELYDLAVSVKNSEKQS